MSAKSIEEYLRRVNMLSVTPTKISDFLICPHKYRLKHIDKIETTNASAALSFGRTMHRSLQHLHRSERYLSDFAGVSELLNRFWETGAYAGAEENGV